MRAHRDRPDTRATAAMRDAERLVQIACPKENAHVRWQRNLACLFDEENPLLLFGM
jgi:hypothetical protein